MAKGTHTPPSVAKAIAKLLGVLVGGAVLGEIVSPLTGPISGPALGIAVLGLPVYGFRLSYVKAALAPAIAVQTLKTASTTRPMQVAKLSVSGANQALKLTAGTNDADQLKAKAEADRARGR